MAILRRQDECGIPTEFRPSLQVYSEGVNCVIRYRRNPLAPAARSAAKTAAQAAAPCGCEPKQN